MNLIKTPVRYFPPFSEIVDADGEPILRVYGAGMEKRHLIGPEIAKAINAGHEAENTRLAAGYDQAKREMRCVCTCQHEYGWHFENDNLPSGRTGCGHPKCECSRFCEVSDE